MKTMLKLVALTLAMMMICSVAFAATTYSDGTGGKFESTEGSTGVEVTATYTKSELT